VKAKKFNITDTYILAHDSGSEEVINMINFVSVVSPNETRVEKSLSLGTFIPKFVMKMPVTAAVLVLVLGLPSLIAVVLFVLCHTRRERQEQSVSLSQAFSS